LYIQVEEQGTWCMVFIEEEGEEGEVIRDE
jgi:hypothetical protein